MNYMSYLNGLIEGQEMGSSIPVQTSELERLKSLIEADCSRDVNAEIEKLHAEIAIRTSYGDEQTDFAIKLAAERDALRAQLAELVEALEKLARLGNGDQYGNSDGNMIARAALSKYKGAK